VNTMHGAVVRMVLKVVLAAAAVGLGGCASLSPKAIRDAFVSTGPTTTQSDPWERFNRAMFGFNEVVDTAVVKPLALTYRAVVPQWARAGVDNFFGNLYDVWSTANLVLQLKPQAALEMGMRVGTNTVFGVAGFVDVADELGLERHSYEDFGKTLGRWGVGSGPYLVLPLLGPTTVRDGLARVVDNQYSPGRLAFREARDRTGATALTLLSARVSLLNASALLDDIALDKYVFVRDAHLSRRRSQIYDGEPPDEPDAKPPAKPAQ
jgi:phospholipid-binding lipoprotein MlaA